MSCLLNLGAVTPNNLNLKTFRSAIPDKGHFEQYLVYCKSEKKDVVSSAREYLENGSVSR